MNRAGIGTQDPPNRRGKAATFRGSQFHQSRSGVPHDFSADAVRLAVTFTLTVTIRFAIIFSFAVHIGFAIIFAFAVTVAFAIIFALAAIIAFAITVALAVIFEFAAIFAFSITVPFANIGPRMFGGRNLERIRPADSIGGESGPGTAVP